VARSDGTERQGAATIIDVARLSGVSKSTVSNVVHGSAPVAQRTREKVLQAIEELGYRPNALARDLKRRRTATVGVVVGDLANPFFGELTKSIEQRTAEAGYAAIICDIHSAADTDREKVALLREQRVAGILMMYFGGDAMVIEEVRRAAVPIIGVSVLDSRFDCVVTDDAKGAAIAVDHLAELGHQRIAYVPGDATEASTLAARLQGWKRALRRHKLRRGPIVTMNEHSAIKGTIGLETALASDDPPTAYFASNDTTALRLIDRLDEAGVRVPQDVSVVGFDDIWIAGLRRVGLTSVRQPVGELAALGVERLLLRIAQVDVDPDAPATQQKLAPTLIPRTTTGPAG
jgi:DNA-binding LacI/PurR family transcriptional regulator